jgi:hypothetical protein
MPSPPVLCKVFDLVGLSPDLVFENEEKSCFVGLWIGKVFEDNGLCLGNNGYGRTLCVLGACGGVGLSSFGE